jgi:hypothetical protein
MKPMRKAAPVHMVALLAAAVLFAATRGAPAGQAKHQEARLLFNRIEIANNSGDVKLVADIDGDGRLDLVLAGFPNDPLSWWRWPDLHRTTIARARVEFTTDAAAVDVDGDGDLDIVVPDGPHGSNLVWFENPRPHGDPTNGAQWKRRDIGTIGGWGKDVKAADFDGDGRMDIAARSSNQLMIFFQDGPDVWRRVPLRGFELGQEGMASGDIDRDGDVDLVLRGVWASNPGGDAARDPARWRAYPIGAFNSAFKALVVDLDQDGRSDILTSSSEHTADIAWFRADHDPTQPWTRHVVHAAVTGAHTLQAADMDRDGTVDVVVGQMHTTKEREISIHYNIDGRGTRWARQIVDDVGLHNGIVADIDGDGYIDIFGSNWAGHPPLRIWLNRGPPAE